MRSSVWLAWTLLWSASGCFFSHGREEARETAERDPPEPTGTPEPAPMPDPGHDICPSTPSPEERCACGVAERLPHPDETGRCFVCSECTECEIDNPADGPLFWDAYLSWQAPGGFAGHGPAVVVRGDGTVRAWEMEPGFDPASEPAAPADVELALGFSEVDQLFLRLQAADTGALPHEGSWAECYPILYFRPCAHCPELRIEYNGASQLRPELDCVIEWFERLPVTSPATHCD